MIELRRGDRFRAFPGRQVLVGGEWVIDVTYRVTVVRRYATNSPEIYYRVDDAGTAGQAHASLAYLTEHGLEIVK